VNLLVSDLKMTVSMNLAPIFLWCTHGAIDANQAQSATAMSSHQRQDHDFRKSFEGPNLRVVRCGVLL